MANATGRGSGEASGKHQGMQRPDGIREADDRLENVGLEDRGRVLEDHLRNKRGKGVAGEYDDSTDASGDRKGIARGD